MKTLLDYAIATLIAGGIAIMLFSTIGVETTQAIDSLTNSLQVSNTK